MGMIVQLSMVCTDRMKPTQIHLLKKYSNNCFYNFDDRPGKLFDGLQHIRATIFLSSNSKSDCNLYTTNYIRWYTENRSHLFDLIRLQNHKIEFEGSIPKIGDNSLERIFGKIRQKKELVNYLVKNSKHNIYFHNAPQYWIRSTLFKPYFWNERDGEKLSVQVKELGFKCFDNSVIANTAINSTTFYLWFIALSDCRHLNKREIESFPISISTFDESTVRDLIDINQELMNSYQENKTTKEASYKTTGNVQYDEYAPKHSKNILDKIDKALANHYKFNPEELDYIINYDIKYRMGSELEDG